MSNKIYKFLHSLEVIFSIIVAVVGLAAIVGWYLDAPDMMQMTQTLGRMNPATALCFALTGITILFLYERFSALTKILSIIIFLIGILAILQDIFEINIGINALAFNSSKSVENINTGRMSGPTAINFCILGLSLFLLSYSSSKSKDWFGGISSSIILSMALTSLIGYFIRNETAIAWNNYVHMTILASILFIAISFILYTRSYLVAKEQFSSIRIYLPFSFICLIVLFMIWHSIDLNFATVDQGKFSTSITYSLFILFFVLLYSLMAFINKRSKSEEKGLLLANERARLTLECGELGLWDWSIENDRITLYKGWIPQQENQVEEVLLNFETWKSLLHPEEKEITSKHLELYLKNSTEAYQAKFRLKNDDGNFVWISARGKIIRRDCEGKPLRLVAVYQDITKDMENEKELINAYLLVYSSQDSILIISKDRIIQTCNAATEKLFGYKKEELINSPLSKIIPKIENERINSITEEIDKSLIPTPFHLELNLKHNKKATISIRMAPILDIHNTTVSYSVICRDVTSELEAIAAQKKLVSLRSSLVTTISHEIRDPLSVIQESFNILSIDLKSKLHPDGLEFIEIAKRNISKLTKLIHDTLDFQLLEMGKAPVKLAKSNLNNAILECLEKAKPDIQKKNISVETHLDHSLPEIDFDKDKIELVLNNIISNATKFTDKGSLTFTTKASVDEVIFELQDTGIGIRDEDKDKVFEVFSQIKSSELRVGSGLGLNMSKRILELHGGRIGFNSEFGKGSTFYFALPIRRSIA